MEDPVGEVVEEESEGDARDGVDGVMRFHIDCSEEQDERKREENPEERAAAGLPCQDERDGGHAHMAAREGRRGVFARILRRQHHLAERSSHLQRQDVGVMSEIVVHLRELVSHSHLHSVRLVVVLRSCHREELEEDIEAEEGSEKHECGALHILISCDEIEEDHRDHQVVVGRVAEVEQLIPEGGAEQLVEHERRLASEHHVVDMREDMVFVVEEAAKLVSLGIPVDKQSEEGYHPQQDGGLARETAIDEVEHEHARQHQQAEPYHRQRVAQGAPLHRDHDGGGAHIEQSGCFESEQPLLFFSLKKTGKYSFQCLILHATGING